VTTLVIVRAFLRDLSLQMLITPITITNITRRPTVISHYISTPIQNNRKRHTVTRPKVESPNLIESFKVKNTKKSEKINKAYEIEKREKKEKK